MNERVTEARLFPGGSMVGWKEDHDISHVLVGIFFFDQATCNSTLVGIRLIK